MKRAVLLSLILTVLLTACASSDPAAVIMSYLEAKVNTDLNGILAVTCAEYESQAQIDANSFESMNPVMQDVTCAVASTTDSEAVVTCRGLIVTTYQGETREWPAGPFPYRLVMEDGEWKMCGFSEDTSADG
ncbi:MAG: hypothetical protein JW910_23565 [Anaerolineae bacterium]|nr:hypothetical protein [Anaerolineae bacterium]